MLGWAPDALQTAEEIALFGHVSAILNSLTCFYELLFLQGMWMQSGSANEAADCLEKAGLHFHALSSKFVRQGRRLFLSTEKAHYCMHIADDLRSSGFNPRFSWTYGDEDFMGRISQIAKATLRGRGPHRLGAVLFERWRTRMYVAWKRA